MAPVDFWYHLSLAPASSSILPIPHYLIYTWKWQHIIMSLLPWFQILLAGTTTCTVWVSGECIVLDHPTSPLVLSHAAKPTIFNKISFMESTNADHLSRINLFLIHSVYHYIYLWAMTIVASLSHQHVPWVCHNIWMRIMKTMMYLCWYQQFHADPQWVFHMNMMFKLCTMAVLWSHYPTLGNTWNTIEGMTKYNLSMLLWCIFHRMIYTMQQPYFHWGSALTTPLTILIGCMASIYVVLLVG